MPKVSSLIPMGPLYQLRKKSTYKEFTLGPDPEFVFTLFACVGLNALKILRAINHKCSVQMSNPKFPIPVADSPEYVSISNVLMRKYHMNKTAKYRELKVLIDLGFIQEHKRKSYNSSRIVRVDIKIDRFHNIREDAKLQTHIANAAITLRKKYRADPKPQIPQGATEQTHTLVKKADSTYEWMHNDQI